MTLHECFLALQWAEEYYSKRFNHSYAGDFLLFENFINYENQEKNINYLLCRCSNRLLTHYKKLIKNHRAMALLASRCSDFANPEKWQEISKSLLQVYKLVKKEEEIRGIKND